MKRPLALLLLLLGGGSGGQAFLIPPPSRSGSSLKPQSHSHPSHGAAAPGITGAGRLCSSAALPLSPSRLRPRGALFASSSVDEQGGQPPPPPPTTTTPPSGRRRGQQRQQRRRTGDDPAHRGKGRAPQQQQPQQRQQNPQFGNLPAAPERPKKPVLTNVVSWLAGKFVRRIAKTVSGLDIDVGARSNGDVLAGNLPRVQVHRGVFVAWFCSMYICIYVCRGN